MITDSINTEFYNDIDKVTVFNVDRSLAFANIPDPFNMVGIGVLGWCLSDLKDKSVL